MKTSLLCTLFLALVLKCAANPIRVLYLGTADRAPRMTAHVLMRDLGRDAIWFDYVSDPADATPEFAATLATAHSSSRSLPYPPLPRCNPSRSDNCAERLVSP